MPRLPNVTMHELEDLVDAASVSASQMHDAADRIGKGYCDKPDKLVQKLVALNAAIGGATALASALLQKLYLEEIRAETERTYNERSKSS